MSATNGQRQDGCPYLNEDDPRCSSRLCLSRIEQAFSVCFGAYHACPMFHRLGAETGDVVVHDAPREVVHSPAIALTLHASPIALRPTGT